MSSKAVVHPYRVLTNGDMSGDLVTLATGIEWVDDVAYQLVWTGNAIGTFSVEATIDGENWVALDLGTPGPAAEGSSNSHLISLGLIPYAKVRVSYDSTSGTGSLSVWIMAKRLGG